MVLLTKTHIKLSSVSNATVAVTLKSEAVPGKRSMQYCASMWEMDTLITKNKSTKGLSSHHKHCNHQLLFNTHNLLFPAGHYF